MKVNDLVRLVRLNGPPMLVVSVVTEEQEGMIDDRTGRNKTLTTAMCVWYCDHGHLHNAVIDVNNLEQVPALPSPDKIVPDLSIRGTAQLKS